MKLISKWKDFYDFVAGHDTDPRKIYIREGKVINKHPLEKQYEILKQLYEIELRQSQLMAKEIFIGEVWFCDKSYPYLKDLINNKIYYDYFKIPIEIKERYKKLITSDISKRHYSLESIFCIEFPTKKKRNWLWHYNYKYNKKRIQEKNQLKINTSFNNPIILTRL